VQQRGNTRQIHRDLPLGPAASNRSKTVGRGWSEWKIAVYLSGVSTLLNHDAMPVYWAAATFGLAARWRLYFTSSLDISRPEWNCTLCRRLIFTERASELTSQLSASIGCGLRLASYAVRRSKMPTQTASFWTFSMGSRL